MSSRGDRSRFLSLVLRHKPEQVGITLDSAGWVEVAALLGGLQAAGRPMTRAELQDVVESSEKKRFAFSADGSRIRASQGRSVEVDLQLEPAVPPEQLYHGTVERFMASIESKGLQPGERHHVHLSADRATALQVGSRRGQPVVLEIDAQSMAADGHVFLLSANGVWLTDAVPPHRLRRHRADPLDG